MILEASNHVLVIQLHMNKPKSLRFQLLISHTSKVQQVEQQMQPSSCSIAGCQDIENLSDLRDGITFWDDGIKFR